MKKTKIICTLGPNMDDNIDLLKAMACNGMDIARFNFSHGSYEEHERRLNMIKEVREATGIPVATLLDTKGPEIRTGELEGGKKIYLKEGETIVLTTDIVEGNKDRVSINYDGLPQDVEAGNSILIDDGLIELRVISKNDTEIVCEIINGGELGERKGVNVPNVMVRLPGITDKDRSDILFGISHEFDFIAASFVRNADCIYEIKDILRENKSDIRVIAKIENKEGIDNIDDIIKASDGIMVARGDMGVEIPAQQVPYIQKMIIKKCNDAFKPVITATQMLDSMIRNPRPTRAEVTDVANAIYDGTDVVMLSGESAVGKYPLETLKMMGQIAESTEQHLEYELLLHKKHMFRKKDTSSAVAYATVATASHLNAKAIIAPTMSGFTARLVSQFRPEAIILGTSPRESVLRTMQIYWGVKPLKTVLYDDTNDIMSQSIDAARESGIIKKGDIAILTAGLPSVNVSIGERGETNVMRVVTVK